MTVRITIASAGAGQWTVDYTAAGAAIPGVAARTLQGAVFPLPETAGALADEPAIQGAVDRLAGRTAADHVPLGDYLFRVLFGDRWPALAPLAGDRIELLASCAGCPMPWELAHDGGDYVFGQRQLVRVVEPPAGAAPLGKVDVPPVPRVLFVVGTRPNDQQIRPAAEYLGVLRRTRRLRTRLLLEATAAHIEAAIDDFAPDVVHFICHGLPGVIRIRGDNASSTLDVDAARLTQILRGKRNVLPRIVVFNACFSATSLMVSGIESLAEQLCAAGVALTIGMSGAIDDQASRVFAWSWYESLARSGDLVASALKARKHMRARIQGAGFDWGLATLFARRDATVDATTSAAATAWLDTAEREHAPPTRPAFVGGWLALRMFDLLVAGAEAQRATYGGPFQILGIHAAPDKRRSPQLGLTYTCRELASRAASSGHLVVHLDRSVVRDLQSDIKATPAADPLGVVAHRLLLELDDAAQAFLARPNNTVVLDTDLRAKIAAGASVKVWHETVRTALADAESELHAASFAGADARIVIIIDDMHVLGDTLSKLLALLDAVLATRNKVVPGVVVVLAFKVQSSTDPAADELLPWLPEHRGVSIALTYLDDEDEAVLAHRQNLLAWRDPPPVALSVALVAKDPARGEVMMDTLRAQATSPGDFGQDGLVGGFVATWRKKQHLREDDDEKALEELRT